jgi:hypothetical protein
MSMPRLGQQGQPRPLGLAPHVRQYSASNVNVDMTEAWTGNSKGGSLHTMIASISLALPRVLGGSYAVSLLQKANVDLSYIELVY